MRTICPDLVKSPVHQIHESDAERGEEVEQLADKVPTGAYDIHGNEELTEIELLREDLLDVLIPLDPESAVGHHEVHAEAVCVVEHVLGERADVPLLEHVTVPLHPTLAVVRVETLG